MRGSMCRLIAVFLAGSFLQHGLIVAAHAENSLPPDGASVGIEVLSVDGERVCETVEELLAELDSDIGGVITLYGDDPIILDTYTEIEVTQPVTVQLPQNGIEIAYLTSAIIRGPVTFTGTRGFTVNTQASLFLYDGVSIEMSEVEGGEAPVAVSLCGPGQLTTDSSVTLRAVGDNAVAIFSDEACSLDLGYAHVIADGNGAIAIDCDGGLTLHHAFVEAEGADSRAIRSVGDAELCQVDASGVVEADTVYSILSRLSPSPQNLIELPVELDMTPRQTVVYENLACGTPPIDFPDRISCEYYYRMLQYGFALLATVDCDVEWDLDGLDYSVPGDYTATATLNPVMPVSGLSVPPFTHEITVVPQNRTALYAEFGLGSHTAVQCLEPIQGAEEILFWVFEDKTGWRELTNTGNAVYAEEWSEALHPSFDFCRYPFFQVTGLEEDALYWVVAQVVGGPMEGFSNLWQMYTGTELGGDRTGTDRYTPRPTTMPPIARAEDIAPTPDTSRRSDDEIASSGSGSSSRNSSSRGSSRSDSSGDSTLEYSGVSAPQAPAAAYEASGAVQVDEYAASGEEPPAPYPPEEWEDATTITISGKRLLALLESGEPVIFIKRGIRIIVDRDALLSLQIQERQLFSVTVELTGDTYTVRFMLDGAEIDPPYTLLLPEPPVDSEAPAVPEADTTEESPAAAAPPEDAAEADAPIPLAAIGMIGGGLMSGGYWLVRKRLPRRRHKWERA